MNKTSIRTVDLVNLLLGATDSGAGAPPALPGHVEDKLASMGSRPARGRRFARGRAV